MKKIVRLNERDLTRIVKRILSERAGEHDMLKKVMDKTQTSDSDSNISGCIIEAVDDNPVPEACKTLVKENRLRSSIERLMERGASKDIIKSLEPLSNNPMSKCMRALSNLGGEVLDNFLDCVNED